MSRIIRRNAQFQPRFFAFQDIEQEARQIVASAEREAADLSTRQRNESVDELARLRETARAAGHAEGRAAGIRAAEQEAAAIASKIRADAAADISSLTSALGTLLSEFDQQRHRLLAEAETGLIRLALSIATRACAIAVERAPDAAIANVRRLLELVAHAADVQLHVHPDELATLDQIVAEFRRTHEALQHVSLCADATVPRGGARLTSAGGWIDGTIESQLQRIAEELLGGATASVAAPAVEPSRQSTASGMASALESEGDECHP